MIRRSFLISVKTIVLLLHQLNKMNFVLCLYEENKLLKRLFGPYRLDYNTGNKCDIDGRHVFERGGLARPECLTFVPDEDAEYQTMIIPKFWFH